MKLTLRQGFVLIDETCAKHASVLEGLQSFAGAQLGTNQKVHDTLQHVLRQMLGVQQKTVELEKNTSLDWRMQSIEDDQQIKERFQPVMKDIELRLGKLEEAPVEKQATEEQIQVLKDRFRPVMQDIEKPLIALESRPIESAHSNVSFAEDPNPTSMTTLIERIQVLESKVSNLEPSLSTLHSSISSTPLKPPEGLRRGEGSTNDPSSITLVTQEMSLDKRIETLEAWVKPMWAELRVLHLDLP